MGCRYCGAEVPGSTGILQGICDNCKSLIQQDIQREVDIKVHDDVADLREELRIYKRGLRRASEDLSFWFKQYNQSFEKYTGMIPERQKRVIELSADEIYNQFIGK